MSKSQWYFEKHGKAEGPVATHEIARKVQEGELHLLDLVFKEGEGQWHPIESFSEITEQVKTTSNHFQPNADWIVLRTVQVDGLEKREQIGPFTLEQVLQLIDKGRIKFSDYVWRTGYENWIPLGQVEDFEAPLLSSVQVDQSLYEKPQRQDLEAKEQKPIKFYKPAQKLRPKEEEAPPEAQGEDLAKPDWQKLPENPKKEMKVKSPPAEASAEMKPQESKEQSHTDKNKKVKVVQQRWRGVASFVVGLLFLFGAGLFTIYGKKAYEFYLAQQERISFEPIEEEIKIVADPKPSKSSPKQTSAFAVPVPSPVIAKSEVKPVTKPEGDEKKPEEPVVSAKSTPPAPPVAKKIESKKLPEVKLDSEEGFMEKGTPKQKSYFVNSERLFLFYNAQKGLRFVTEVEKMFKKPPAKKQTSKAMMAAWLKQVKAFYKQTESAAQQKRLYPELYKKLNTTTKNLLERGTEIELQLVNGRGLAKDMSFVEITADYKKLAKNAQAID